MDNNEFNEFELPKKVGEVKVESSASNEVPNMINDLKESVNIQKGSYSKFFKDIFKYLTTRNTHDLFELLWRLAMIAIFVLLLYVPVQLCHDLLLDFLISVGVEFSDRARDIYDVIFNATYSIFGIVLFFVICKERYYKYALEEEKMNSINK